LTEETSASTIYRLQLRLDRFIIDFVLNLIIKILIGFGCRADRFSNTGTAASRDRWLQYPPIRTTNFKSWPTSGQKSKLKSEFLKSLINDFKRQKKRY
jgi:hypothetical protein